MIEYMTQIAHVDPSAAVAADKVLGFIGRLLSDTPAYNFSARNSHPGQVWLASIVELIALLRHMKLSRRPRRNILIRPSRFAQSSE